MNIRLFRSKAIILTCISLITLSVRAECNETSPTSACAEPLTPKFREKRKVVTWNRGALIDQGNFSVTQADLENYFRTNKVVAGSILLNRPMPADSTYKINERYEFQIKNWYDQYENLSAMQQQFQIDIDKFINNQHASSFNEAKIKFFSALPFDDATYMHARPHYYMKEWGNLNHPPLTSLGNATPEKISANYAPVDYDSDALNDSVFFKADFHRRIDEISKSELTSDNHFRIIVDSESFQEKLKHIREAKKSIWVSSLVFVNDETTRQIVDELINAVGRGVDVRVIVEKSLSIYHRRLAAKMSEAGVKVVYADDFFRYNSMTVYHSKVMIFDGAQFISGGQNMIDADLGSEGTNFKNRDADILVNGPVVTDVIAVYMRDWNHFVTKNNIIFRHNQSNPAFSAADIADVETIKAQQRDAGVRGSQNYETWLSNKAQRMTGLSRFVSQTPGENVSVITDTYIEYLKTVKSYLGLTNPLAADTKTEFRPERGLHLLYSSYKNFNRLWSAIDAVVKQPSIHVDYLTSGADFALNEAVPMTELRISRYLDRDANIRANINQVWMDRTNYRLARTPYQNLLNDYVPYPNVNVWIHNSFIHSKVVDIDHLVLSLGSFNIQHNATDHSYESTLFIQDVSAIKQAEAMLALDMANSVPLVYSNRINAPK